ncbi:hypothetical protein BUALT_Bualt13G0059600 [Buddleja alternifolia]|uniref:Fatty acyl-CoA reductase n=1 Tax=Buddleja alternifolia TaxID=168488 RepID=A0AAV6WKC9_9LAMI|nr:hypothetical protein BUALT_Bualt13G0059600 [Buddleja alternifolia]
MGEMLLEEFKENVNVVIIRPTIVTSTYREPFPGWMEGLRTIDSVFAGYAKRRLKVLLGDPNSTQDVMLKVLNIILCNHYESSYASANRKFNLTKRTAELYKPFVFSHGVFDDSNTENLRMAMKQSNQNDKMFDFEPKSIQWEEYFINTHFPGIVKYVLE